MSRVRQVEALTINLASVNRRCKVHAGVRITDVQGDVVQWRPRGAAEPRALTAQGGSA